MKEPHLSILPYHKALTSTHTLQATLDTFKAAFNSLEDALFILDTSFCIAYLNPKAVAVAKTAYNVDLCVGDHMIYSFPEFRWPDLLRFFNRVLNGETIQYQIQTFADVWLDCRYAPIVDSSGTITGINATVKNCTLQKQLEAQEQKTKALEAAHKESLLLFEQFMNHSPLVGWIIDQRGKLCYMNPTYLQTFGFTSADIGKSIYELFPDQVAIDYHLNDMKVIKGGRLVEVTEKALLPNGREQTLKIYKFPIHLKGEVMVAGWAVDITANTQLHEQLELSVERYEHVQEATSDAIYDWQLHHKKIYRGKGFQTLFGYEEPSVSIRERFRNIHPEDRDRIKAIYFEALREPQAEKWELEYQFQCADGTYKYVIDKAVIKRIDGKVVRVLGALQDVSEQKELHAKLLKQEKKAKREVVKSIIEAQEKERRKLSVELHDNVNQMLASCKLMLELACDSGASAKTFTQKSYHSINQIISEIRRISHNLNPSALQDVGLVEAIQEMVATINATGKLHLHFIHQGCEEKECLLDNDRIALFRIIQEYVNNILKHSKATNAHIYLNKMGKKFQLKMEDNGIGFEVEKAKKGLGLQYIQHRIDYYQGSFQIYSEKEKGTKVVITLCFEK